MAAACTAPCAVFVVFRAHGVTVLTPQERRQRLQWNDFFLKEVVKRGEVLYESRG